MRTPEHAARLVYIAECNRLARSSTGEWTARVAGHRVNTDSETHLCTERAQERQIARSLRSKTEVLADDYDLGTQFLDDELAHEPLRGPGGESSVELPDEDRIDTERAHQLGAPFDRGEPRRCAGPDHGRRMRVERQHHG